jgi:hypothetical protein
LRTTVSAGIFLIVGLAQVFLFFIFWIVLGVVMYEEAKKG